MAMLSSVPSDSLVKQEDKPEAKTAEDLRKARQEFRQGLHGSRGPGGVAITSFQQAATENYPDQVMSQYRKVLSLVCLRYGCSSNEIHLMKLHDSWAKVAKGCSF